eukprot:scaffold62521_cov59-Phaeocystis_antarctica.AAC.2
MPPAVYSSSASSAPSFFSHGGLSPAVLSTVHSPSSNLPYSHLPSFWSQKDSSSCSSPSVILRRVAMNDLRRSPGRPSNAVRYLIVTPLAA